MADTFFADELAAARILRIKRAAASAAILNPEEMSEDATGITFTMGAAADASLTRKYGTVAGAAPLENIILPQVARFTGGRYALEGNNRIVMPVANAAPSNGNLSTLLPATPGYNAWGYEMEFVTNAPKLQVRMAGNVVRGVRATVRNRYVSKAPLMFQANSSQNYPTLEFATQDMRTVRLECAGSDQIIHVAVPPTSYIARSEGSLDRVVALVAGDSYPEGTGATVPGLFAFSKAIGRSMGWGDTRQVALGQSSYLPDPAGLRKSLRQQVADWPIVNSDLAVNGIMPDVDVVCVFMGYNDYSRDNVLALLEAETVLAFQAIRAMCPNAIIFIFGSHAGARGPDVQTLAVDALIQSGFARWNDPRSRFIPIASDPAPWTFGKGFEGALKGDGIADLAISADGSHPNNFGHSVYRARAVNALRGALSRF